MNVPIGLISANWGGSNIEPWISAYGFSTQESLRGRYNNLVKIIPGTPEYKQNQAQIVADMQKWIEESTLAIAANDYLPEIPASIYENPRLTGSRQDTVLFNNMIAPYTKFAIKGALWYQGCANLSNGMAYRDKMHALIASWRKEFDMPEMPLYFVQLAPFTYGDKNLLPYFWTVQQRFADEDPYAKMAVINDIGDYRDIHPRNKHDVGHRLALLALKYTYGKKDLVADSPFFESLDRDGKDLIVTFRNATTLKTTDNNPAKYFEIAGIDRVFYPATAEIIGNKVKLSSDKVAEPYSARYAWNQNVTTTLVNENNLPAGTFWETMPLPIRKNLDAFVPEAKNMKVLYSLPVSNIKEGGRVMYFANNSAELAGKKIKKIGYFMYLKNSQGDKYVYATVDPFTQDVTKLGLPSAENAVLFQQTVKNLTVKSNVASVTNGKFADGNVEIWPSDYTMPNTAKVENASDKSYDFGDSGANANRNGYGSWQLHNFRNKEVIFALNHFNAPVTDVGIGNNPKGHLDYTFTNSSRQYNYGELLVLVEVE